MTAVVEPELRVTVDPGVGPEGPWPVLKVAGEVDIQTSPLLEDHVQRVLGEGTSSIVVDLGEVTFLDSTGLSVLIAGLKRCQSAGGTMHLRGAQPNVRRVFEITGLTDVFAMEPATDD